MRTQILTKGSMSFEIYSEAESYYTEVKFIAFLPLKTIKFVLIRFLHNRINVLVIRLDLSEIFMNSRATRFSIIS